MQIISLTVAAALSFGVSLADTSESEGESLAPSPQCIPTTIDQCRQTAMLPATTVPMLEPSPAYGAQAKRFSPLY